MPITRFEELEAWQQARVLSREVYEMTRRPKVARDFALCGQIQRAAVSSMSNIAEGFERARPKEFHQALSTAKASAAEVRSLLYVALDVGYVSEDEFRTLYARADRAGHVIGGLRRAVERRLQRAEPVSRKNAARSTQHAARSAP